MISQNLIQSIGWTLIHSLWQGLLIFVFFKIASRLIQRSDVKYGLGVASLALLIVSAIATFLVLNQKSDAQVFQLVLNATRETTITESWSVLNFINANIIWLLRFWALGFVVGLLRIAAGLWYIGRLRRNAHPVQDEWMDMVKRLSESLNVNHVVAMAEAGISSPMVVGFMKPVILFPVGLLSGLSTEQVETILVHELSHIRRQDYIINLVQSVIETIFFFNPFALLISSMIREERENCCDDVVIAKGINPLTYVRTLAQLEAARSSSTLALGFAGNQNQLLNRIKRIMENSAKNDWGKGRLVPVALLFLGLVCASWLSISSEKEIQQAKHPHKVLASDTSKENGLVVIKRGNGYSSWHTIEPAPPVPPVDAFDAFESIPPIEDIPPGDVIPDMPEFPPIPDFAFRFDMTWADSIPGVHFRKSTQDWESFEEEFTEKFRTQFKDFYEKNQDQFQKLMEDLKRDEANRREAAEEIDLADLKSFERMNADMQHLAKLRAFEQSKDMVQIQKMQMEIMNDQFRDQKFMFEDMQRKTEAWKSALIEMLVEDGYLKKGEDNLSLNDNNGDLMINGQKVKEADAVKYRALRDTYFGAKRIQRDSYRRSE